VKSSEESALIYKYKLRQSMSASDQISKLIYRSVKHPTMSVECVPSISLSSSTTDPTLVLLYRTDCVVTAAADIFHNWRTVTIKGRQSTRSSCPHYASDPDRGQDSQQNMDKAAIDYLKSKGVKYVISANSIKLPQAQIDAMKAAGIGYKWLEVEDFGAPSPEKFKECHKAYLDHTHVHFYCGWGNGRTGTYVSGVQIWEGVYTTKPTWADYEKNFVETSDQMKALDTEWTSWHKKHHHP
jgi:hypothetical protein